MFCKTCVTAICLAAVAAVGIAAAQPGKDHKSPTPSAPAAGQPEDMIPPGMTKEEWEACKAASQPGEMHAWLTKGVGTWKGKEQMWMTPGAPAETSDVTSVSTSLMGGRFVQCNVTGEMMKQPFHGMSITGYDNTTKKFVASWIDNHGTGIMQGTGELSSDKKTLTWNYTFVNPMTKKTDTMREVDTFTGADTFKMEMYSADPQTGKEFKMIQIDFTRQK